jgi:hypothetical protein
MQLAYQAEGLAVAHADHVVLCAYSAVPDVAFFKALRGVEDAVLAAHPAGLAIFNLIRKPGKMFIMDGAARDAATRLAADMAPRTLGIANVVEATGFFAATARTIIGSVAVMTQSRVPQRTLDSVNEAVPWLCERMRSKASRDVTELELHAWVNTLRNTGP